MAFRKIETSDLTGKGVTGLPDTPRLTTDAMQKKFDELSKDVIVPIFNEFVEQMEKDTAAADIGVKAPEHFEEPTGKLQALLDVLAAVIYENQQARHTHENKLTLDEITKDKKKGYDRLVTLLENINIIDYVVTGGEARIPTSKAITEFVEELGGGDMVRATYDTNRNGIVDNAERLGGNDPEYYQPVHDEKLETNAKTIPEAINEVNAKEPDVLDTMEEINANTDSGKVAGAMAVKELSRDLPIVKSVTGSFPSAVNNWSEAVAYPEGFTKENCIPVAIRSKQGESSREYYNASGAQQIETTDSGVRVYLESAGNAYVNGQFIVYLVAYKS